MDPIPRPGVFVYIGRPNMETLSWFIITITINIIIYITMCNQPTTNDLPTSNFHHVVIRTSHFILEQKPERSQSFIDCMTREETGRFDRSIKTIHGLTILKFVKCQDKKSLRTISINTVLLTPSWQLKRGRIIIQT